jgi:hypothetical protein
VQLRAGPLTADVENGDIRSISFRGVEIVQRLYATVRDDRWGTAETVVRGAIADGDRRAFTVRVEGESVLAGQAVAVWQLHATGTAAGTLDADLEWRATAAFPCNRIGLCVHHPTATWTGAGWRTRLDGVDDAGRLGPSVLPQPVVDGLHLPAVGPFGTLRLEHGATWTSLSSPDGPLELEDQRNWGDASYKSYPSPISPAPRAVETGETGRASVRIAAGAGARPPAPSAPSLRDAGPFPAVVTRAPEVVMVEAESAEPVLAALRAARPARVVLTTPSGAPASRAALAALQHALAPIPVGAGTPGSFSELNRRRQDIRDAGALSWSLDPQVHATDSRSIMENVTGLRDQLATAAAIAPGAECHVAVDLAHGRDDRRRGTSFEAAWMVGVLAGAAGRAASILVPAPEGRTADVVAQMMSWKDAQAVVLDDPRRRVAGVGIRAAGGIELLLANLTPRRVGAPLAGRRLVLAAYEVRSVTTSA